MKRRILIIVFTLMILASNVGTTFAEGFKKTEQTFLKAKREENSWGYRSWRDERDFETSNNNKTIRFYIGNQEYWKVNFIKGRYIVAPKQPNIDGKKFIGWYDEDGVRFDFTVPATESKNLIAKFEEKYTSRSKLNKIRELVDESYNIKKSDIYKLDTQVNKDEYDYAIEIGKYTLSSLDEDIDIEEVLNLIEKAKLKLKGNKIGNKNDIRIYSADLSNLKKLIDEESKVKAEDRYRFDTDFNKYQYDYAVIIGKNVFNTHNIDQETVNSIVELIELSKNNLKGKSNEKLLKYNVYAYETSNGSIFVDKLKSAKGEKVTISVKPDVGFELDYIKCESINGDEINLNNNIIIMPSSDVVLTAVFKPIPQQEYSVVFDIDGDSNTIPTAIVKSGERVEKPINPIKEGYKFKFWSLDGINEYNFDTRINESIILKAVFTNELNEDYKTVMFDVEGNEFDIPQITVGYKESAIKPEQIPQKEGYKFKFWSEDGINEFDFNTSIVKDVKLKAVFEILPVDSKKYNVTYSFVSDSEIEIPDEIMGLLPSNNEVSRGESVTASKVVNSNGAEVVQLHFIKNDGTIGCWEFKGWTPDKFESVSEDIKFVGKWSYREVNDTVNSKVELEREIKRQILDLKNPILVKAKGFQIDLNSLDLLDAETLTVTNQLSYGLTAWYRGNEEIYLVQVQPRYFTEDKNVIDKYHSDIQSWVDRNINSNMNDEQKVRAIHDHIVNKVHYRSEGGQGRYSQFSPLALHYDNHGVCQGYATYFYAFAKKANLNVEIVSGMVTTTSPNSSYYIPREEVERQFRNGQTNHMWNRVQVDGAWYQIDLTWNDPTNSSPNYEFYLVNDDKLRTREAGYRAWDVSKHPNTSSISYPRQNITNEENIRSVGEPNESERFWMEETPNIDWNGLNRNWGWAY